MSVAQTYKNYETFSHIFYLIFIILLYNIYFNLFNVILFNIIPSETLQCVLVAHERRLK